MEGIEVVLEKKNNIPSPPAICQASCYVLSIMSLHLILIAQKLLLSRDSEKISIYMYLASHILFTTPRHQYNHE